MTCLDYEEDHDSCEGIAEALIVCVPCMERRTVADPVGWFKTLGADATRRRPDVDWDQTKQIAEHARLIAEGKKKRAEEAAKKRKVEKKRKPHKVDGRKAWNTSW